MDNTFLEVIRQQINDNWDPRGMQIMKNRSTSNALILQMALFMAIRVFHKIISRKEIFEERQQFGFDYFASPINFLLKIGASKTIY